MDGEDTIGTKSLVYLFEVSENIGWIMFYVARESVSGFFLPNVRWSLYVLYLIVDMACTYIQPVSKEVTQSGKQLVE